ncbi:MAG: hypothetical protein QM719_13080 [Thermomonas sp.]
MSCARSTSPLDASTSTSQWFAFTRQNVAGVRLRIAKRHAFDLRCLRLRAEVAAGDAARAIRRQRRELARGQRLELAHAVVADVEDAAVVGHGDRNVAAEHRQAAAALAIAHDGQAGLPAHVDLLQVGHVAFVEAEFGTPRDEVVVGRGRGARLELRVGRGLRQAVGNEETGFIQGDGRAVGAVASVAPGDACFGGDDIAGQARRLRGTRLRFGGIGATAGNGEHEAGGEQAWLQRVHGRDLSSWGRFAAGSGGAGTFAAGPRLCRPCVVPPLSAARSSTEDRASANAIGMPVFCLALPRTYRISRRTSANGAHRLRG